MRDKNINHLWHNQGSEIGHRYVLRPRALLTQLDYACKRYCQNIELQFLIALFEAQPR